MAASKRPRTSWEGPYDPERSPLKGLAALDPPIVITDEARRKAAEKLEVATRPYRKSPPVRRTRRMKFELSESLPAEATRWVAKGEGTRQVSKSYSVIGGKLYVSFHVWDCSTSPGHGGHGQWCASEQEAWAKTRGL